MTNVKAPKTQPKLINDTDFSTLVWEYAYEKEEKTRKKILRRGTQETKLL